jgi:hypothetical protein
MRKKLLIIIIIIIVDIIIDCDVDIKRKRTCIVENDLLSLRQSSLVEQ